jgi:dinuclear metal center YbgI/SA1388 family protein
MLTLQTLKIFLHQVFSNFSIKDYCPNGLQVEGKDEIKSICTAVSASLSTIEAAVERQADVLIVHHGLFWQNDSYVIEGTKRKKIALLIEHGISLFAYHLPLDLHPELGNNWKAAKDLGWTNLQPFGVFNGIPIGVKGEISSSSREELRTNLEKYYDHPAISAWGGKERIQTIALISGGAYKNLTEAAREGIDAFVTGNFDEPAWHQAFEEKINFLSLGHSATERIGPMALKDYLSQELKIKTSFIDIHNPF